VLRRHRRRPVRQRLDDESCRRRDAWFLPPKAGSFLGRHGPSSPNNAAFLTGPLRAADPAEGGEACRARLGAPISSASSWMGLSLTLVLCIAKGVTQAETRARWARCWPCCIGPTRRLIVSRRRIGSGGTRNAPWRLGTPRSRRRSAGRVDHQLRVCGPFRAAGRDRGGAAGLARRGPRASGTRGRIARRGLCGP
jgi:hypothetical protein